MMNIVIPIAGSGSRFVHAGYSKPKPFIDVLGKPMIIRVLDNLAFPDARYILIARKDHMESEIELVRQIEREYDAMFIPIDKLTEGTACTVLYSRKQINNDEQLIIANSDQIVDLDIREFVADCVRRSLDGSILTFEDPDRDPKWSFAKLGPDNMVMEVQEKKPISNFATVGIYLFSHGRDFVDAAIDMIIKQDRVNNEYYTCPTYNYMIRDGKRVGIFNIPINSMHGIGTPDDLSMYIAQESSCNVLRGT